MPSKTEEDQIALNNLKILLLKQTDMIQQMLKREEEMNDKLIGYTKEIIQMRKDLLNEKN